MESQFNRMDYRAQQITNGIFYYLHAPGLKEITAQWYKMEVGISAGDGSTLCH